MVFLVIASDDQPLRLPYGFHDLDLQIDSISMWRRNDANSFKNNRNKVSRTRKHYTSQKNMHHYWYKSSRIPCKGELMRDIEYKSGGLTENKIRGFLLIKQVQGWKKFTKRLSLVLLWSRKHFCIPIVRDSWQASQRTIQCKQTWINKKRVRYLYRYKVLFHFHFNHHFGLFIPAFSTAGTINRF